MQYIAPQDLRAYGMIPEIIGRLPILTFLHPLDRKALRSILTEPKNSIIKQYVKLFEIDNITLRFDDDALDFIVDKAVEFKLGARGLRSICEAIMMEVMFELPSTEESELTITSEYATVKSRKDQSAAFESSLIFCFYRNVSYICIHINTEMTRIYTNWWWWHNNYLITP